MLSESEVSLRWRAEILRLRLRMTLVKMFSRRIREEQEASWQEQQRVETPFLRELRERLTRERQRIGPDVQQEHPHAA